MNYGFLVVALLGVSAGSATTFAFTSGSSWTGVALLSLAALSLLAALYLALAARVRLSVLYSPRHVNLGTDGVYRIRVENRWLGASRVRLEVQSVPEGWFAAFAFPTLSLKRGESTIVPLVVKVPFSATVGVGPRLRVRARPNRWSPWMGTLDLEMSVADVILPPSSVTRAAPVAP